MLSRSFGPAGQYFMRLSLVLVLISALAYAWLALGRSELT